RLVFILFLSVTLLNLLQRARRKPCEQGAQLLRSCDPALDDHIHEVEQRECCLLVVLQIDSAGMYCVVTNHPHHVERLLNFYFESLLNQFHDISVQIVAGLTELLHELLDTQARKGSRGALNWEKTALERARYETFAARGNDLLDDEDPHLALLLALEFLRLPKAQKEVTGWAIEGLAYKALEFLLPKKLYDSLLPREADDRSIEALAYNALQTPQPKAILLTEAPFPTATFSPDGRLLLISKGNAFRLWDTDKITPVGKEFIPEGMDARWRTIWSHDAQWLIGSNADKETMLFRPCSVDKLREYFQRCDNDVDFIRTIHVGDDTASW